MIYFRLFVNFLFIMKKIPVEIRNQVIELRRNGLSYP